MFIQWTLTWQTVVIHTSHLQDQVALQHLSCITGWWLGVVVASFVARTKLLNVDPVSTGMDDHLRAGTPPRYVIKPSTSTEPCIPLGSLNQVRALIGWGRGRNVTSSGWQVTLCDPISHAHVSSRSERLVV